MSNNKPGFRAGRDQGAVTENMELLTGQRGTGLDRAVTLRDLASLGIAKLRRFGRGGSVIPSLNPELMPGAGVQRPGEPLNLEAAGAFHNIILSWDKPTYTGHAYTEIWRAPTDNLAEAVMVGTTSAHVFADAVGASLSAWYWVRFINANNIEGPYSGPGGVYAETSRAIDDILEEMAGKISESELADHLRDTIGDLDSLWSAKVGVGDITAGIGLVAREDGSTEAAVAAGRFSVFDPAKPLTKDNLFVVEGGKVYMNTAFIKQAYIESLAAAQITADKINTLILNAVKITGGTLKIGNNFEVKSNGDTTTNNMTGNNFKGHNATFTGSLTVPDASIKRANIGVAEVDTLRIAGQAVTVPVSAQGEGSATTPSGNFEGQPVTVTAQVAVKGANPYFSILVYRSGTLLKSKQGYENTISSTGTLVLILVDNPPKGNHYYQVVASGGSSRSCGITAIGCKR